MKINDTFAFVCNCFVNNPDAILSVSEDPIFPYIEVRAPYLEQAFLFLKKDEHLQFDFLECITGVDTSADFVIIYKLISTVFKNRIFLKVTTDRYRPIVPSASHVWPAAHFYELELYDLFGIEFDNHPEFLSRPPKRLFLPQKWQGFPLRKDYVYPEDFSGIEHRRLPLRKEHIRP